MKKRDVVLNTEAHRESFDQFAAKVELIKWIDLDADWLERAP